MVCAKNAGKDLSRKTHAKGQLAEARRGRGVERPGVWCWREQQLVRAGLG